LNASWKRRRADVATRIEISALKLFLENGIDAVTVDDIAAAAEISRRSFYRYFESPGHILSTVLCRSLDLWAHVVRARPKNESMLASFRAANEVALGFPETSEPLTMAMGIMRRSPEAWRRVTGPIQAYTTKAYEQIIAERLNAVGEDPRSAGAIAAGLTAIMIHLGQERARENKALGFGSEQLEQTVEALQKLIAPPTKAKAKPHR